MNGDLRLQAEDAMKNALQAVQPPNLGGFDMGINNFCSLDLKSHKRLYDLAYSVKVFIDAQGGLSKQETCRFGNIMAEIIHLK